MIEHRIFPSRDASEKLWIWQDTMWPKFFCLKQYSMMHCSRFGSSCSQSYQHNKSSSGILSSQSSPFWQRSYKIVFAGKSVEQQTLGIINRTYDRQNPPPHWLLVLHNNFEAKVVGTNIPLYTKARSIGKFSISSSYQYLLSQMLGLLGRLHGSSKSISLNRLSRELPWMVNARPLCSFDVLGSSQMQW